MKFGDIMLKIKDLNFSYNQIKVLDKINFGLEQKDFMGIIGPNGSGKSTLLRNINNILKPDSGAIYLDNNLLNKINTKELAKKMAVVPQETIINFNFTVYDLIMMGRHPYQDRWGRVKEKDKNIIEEVMQLTDTSKFRTKNINELSGGEKQRVIIARALAQKPDILLLDEPTSSLDINYQGEIFDLLSHLNQRLDLTILTVSHDLNLTSQYCDDIILLNQGEIFAAGSPEEVLTETNINRVYQTEVIVKTNPLTDRPYVTLIPGKYRSDSNINSQKLKIHIICGGGSGKEIMERLYYKGYDLSCGVINQGDSDWEMATKLNLDLIEIPPFSYIDQNSLLKVQSLIKDADVLIITDTPFGHGNVKNLKLVSEIKDQEIILMKKKDISERDYTNGKATEYWNQIIGKNKTRVVKDINEIFDEIKKID